MKLSMFLWCWSGASLLATLVAGQGSINGYPANPYDPFCAMTCLRSLYSLTLSCSEEDGGTLGMMIFSTSSACWAENTPYLTSLAWCMHVKCAEFDVLNSKLELFWEQQATGQGHAGVKSDPPKWSYNEALANVTTPPTVQLNATSQYLNTTSLVSPSVYLAQWNILTNTQRETVNENTYGISMLVAGVGTPILLTGLAYAPITSSLIRRLKPYLVWPSIIGTYQIRPLPFLLGNAPTVGQSLYIAGFIFLNIIFTSINYQSRQPNAWYSTKWQEIMAYVLWRTGALAYIIGPLVFLFAGRNNFLLWLTNWSHSTYIILHRWVARVFCLQAILHSILAVVLEKEEGFYPASVKEKYWIWGIVATVAVVILTFSSGLWVRSFSYELFLLGHIVFSVILLVGCWYHATDLYHFLGGYQTWVTTMASLWFFDRVARVARVAMVGLRRAKVTELGDGGYLKITVPGIRWGSEPGKHVYVYFPTINPLRPWENHSFSVLPTALLQANHPGSSSVSDAATTPPAADVEKHDPLREQIKPVSHTDIGLTIYVKRSAGMTRSLSSNDRLPVLLEGPYSSNSNRGILRCDRVLLIAGGIGITGILPFLKNHWNIKLAWSIKESAKCLVDDLDGAMA
ncbi:Ferric reductase like transmembrane component domain containing protein [Hyaloscypha variabilis]